MEYFKNQDIEIIYLDKDNFLKLTPMINKSFESNVYNAVGFVDTVAVPYGYASYLLNNKENMYSYCVKQNNKIIGGFIVNINNDTNINTLELFFIDPSVHSKGVGLLVWNSIEQMFPNTIKWIAQTPFFSKRNIHFYLNKCKFKIVFLHHEFNLKEEDKEKPEYQLVKKYGMVHFEKEMKN